MDKQSLENNYYFEDTYWWFLGRRRIVKSFVRKYAQARDSIRALDAGCGTGIVLSDLKEFCRDPIGIDSSELALEYTKKRGSSSLICADLDSVPFKDNTFDLVTILGVLYNMEVKDDDKVIKEAYRILRKGGILIIDEAAYDFLESAHNRSVGGIRRYTRNRLTDKCRKQGFKVLKASYWNVLMLPVFFVAVLMDKCFAGKKQYAGLKRIPKPVNRILKQYLYFEELLLRRVSFPFGPSIIMVVQKDV